MIGCSSAKESRDCFIVLELSCSRRYRKLNRPQRFGCWTQEKEEFTLKDLYLLGKSTGDMSNKLSPRWLGSLRHRSELLGTYSQLPASKLREKVPSVQLKLT